MFHFYNFQLVFLLSFEALYKILLFLTISFLRGEKQNVKN